MTDQPKTAIVAGVGAGLGSALCRRLADAGISCRVFDLRWLAPMPIEAVLEQSDPFSLLRNFPQLAEVIKADWIWPAVQPGCRYLSTAPAPASCAADTAVPERITVRDLAMAL